MRSRVHAVVSGLVQGVGFRWFVMSRANALGLHGWVRNLVTGEVEFVAQGPRDSLELLVADVRRGPRSSQVTDIRVDWDTPLESLTSFEIR